MIDGGTAKPMADAVVGLTPLLSVYDMNQALAFYRDALGFDVVAASPEVQTPEGRFSHWTLLRLGGAEVMLNTTHDSGERPAERDRARECGHRDVSLFIGCSDIDAVHRDMKARGVEAAAPATAPYGLRRFTLRDPDGYEVVFQAIA